MKQPSSVKSWKKNLPSPLCWNLKVETLSYKLLLAYQSPHVKVAATGGCHYGRDTCAESERSEKPSISIILILQSFRGVQRRRWVGGRLSWGGWWLLPPYCRWGWRPSEVPAGCTHGRRRLGRVSVHRCLRPSASPCTHPEEAGARCMNLTVELGFKIKHLRSARLYLEAAQSCYLRFGAEDFGVQRVGHHVACWVSHPNEEVRCKVLSYVYSRSILTPGLLNWASYWLHSTVGSCH